MLRAITNSLLSIAFPQPCHNCKQAVDALSEGVACAGCWAQTRMFSFDDPLCPKCGDILPSIQQNTASNCHQCDDHSYDSAAAGGVYEKALAAVILELKKAPNLPEKARLLLLSAFERSSFGDVSVIIPVPLSAKRRIERGYNQAEVIGEYLSKKTGIVLDGYSLVRRVHTPMHRAGMDKKAREATVKNAFEVHRPKLIADKSVLLVDDIFTSGATASYCAKVLKKSGAAKVNVLTLARAVSVRV